MKVIAVLIFEWFLLLSIAGGVAYTVHLVSQINEKVSFMYDKDIR